MKRAFVFITLILALLVNLGGAADYSSPYTDPRGICPEMSYRGAGTDVWGDIVGTIPWGNPGPNYAWVGSTWANGQLIVCENVAPNTSPSRFFKVNPQTGAILDSVNFPFNGFVMGATFDGTDLWVVQWSPTSAVHKVSLNGVELASYSLMSTYPYNCRAIMWDGQFLWMGANDVANNTRLYRMTTGGVVQLSFVSSASVGWYMDGEFDTNAPFGSNFCIVDNVGNTIKRLMITGSIVVGVNQSPSPAVTPDVAEGLAFDGDYLWHNGAYANQGLIWKIDDGIAAPPLVDITLTPLNPPIVVPAQGGSFSFNVSVVNHGPAGPFSVWARIKYPNGTYTLPVLGPVSINPPPNVIVTRQRTQTVLATWSSGIYTYIGYASASFTYPPTWDSSYFNFTKSAVADGGPSVWEATCSGEPFPGEVTVANPTGFSLMAAYPNPFNPATTISFILPEASHVNLTVYDLNGRQVSTLVNGWQAPGNHQVNFDGSKLSSGVYLCRLQAGNISSCQKLMLLK